MSLFQQAIEALEAQKAKIDAAIQAMRALEADVMERPKEPLGHGNGLMAGVPEKPQPHRKRKAPPKKVPCGHCGVMFDPRGLIRHEAICDPRPAKTSSIRCDWPAGCDRTFMSAREMGIHKTKSHYSREDALLSQPSTLQNAAH